MNDRAEFAPSRVWRGPKFVLTMLFVASIFNLLDRQLPFILMESIKHDLQLSDKQIGLLGGVFFALIYSCMALPVAVIADRWSPKWVLSLCITGWCGLTALSGFAQNFWQFGIARGGVAIGEAGCTPGAHAMISALIPSNRRGIALSIFSLGVPVGGTLGLIVGGWLNDVGSWRVAMLAVGIPGVMFGLLFALTMPDVRSHAAKTHASPFAGVRKLLALRSFRHLVTGVAVQGISQYAIFTFSAVFLIRVHGLSSTQAGLWLGLANGVSGVIALLTAGFLTDRANARGRPVLVLPAVAFGIGAPLILIAYLAPNAYISLIFLALINFCAVSYLPPAFSTAQRLAGSEARAVASATLLFGTSFFGGSLGPFLAGAISDALTPRFGVDGLRYALCCCAIPNIWAVVHLTVAGRFLPGDIADGDRTLADASSVSAR